MTLEYILNKPSIMENDGKLRKREYTLLLKHNMSNISKVQWWLPLISSYPRWFTSHERFNCQVTARKRIARGDISRILRIPNS